MPLCCAESLWLSVCDASRYPGYAWCEAQPQNSIEHLHRKGKPFRTAWRPSRLVLFNMPDYIKEAKRAKKEGDLSKAGAILDPGNGLPFPGGLIPQSRISPQANALLKYYPLPNFDPGARYNYQIPIVGVTDQDSVQSRLAKTLTPKTEIPGEGWFAMFADPSGNRIGVFSGMNAQR